MYSLMEKIEGEDQNEMERSQKTRIIHFRLNLVMTRIN